MVNLLPSRCVSCGSHSSTLFSTKTLGLTSRVFVASLALAVQAILLPSSSSANVAPTATPEPTFTPCEEFFTPTPVPTEAAVCEAFILATEGQSEESCNPCVTECPICGENNELCMGCDEQPMSGKVVDACGVCGGDGSSCAGCDKVPNSGKQYDQCGVCGGNNVCLGCDNVPNSGLVVDSCGVCGGDNSSCAGCDGVPKSGKTIDRCGICGGNNACVGCDNVPFSGKTLDVCGVCGGNGTSCTGCDGVPKSGLIYDLCGVCGGNGTICAGCDGVPGSRQRPDSCGICGGDGSTCAPRPSACTTKNMSSTQAQLDGSAHSVANVGRGVLKAYVRYAPDTRAAKKYAGQTLSQIQSLEVQTWANAWSLPNSILVCPENANCASISTATATGQYESNLTLLRQHVFDAALKLQKLRSRNAKSSAKANLKRLEAEYGAGLALLKEYPKVNANCSTNAQ